MGSTLTQFLDVLDSVPNWDVRLAGDGLQITNEEGIEAFVAVSGEQVLVESLLFTANQVTDKALINQAILESHWMFPLTAVGVKNGPLGECYFAYGALSAASHKDDLILEVDTLFTNVHGFLEAYAEFLTVQFA